MDVTVDELAALVGGRVVSGPGDVRITGAASLSEAGQGDITFFGNAKYLPALKTTRATCALVPTGFAEVIPATQIQVENPSLAFTQVLERLCPSSESAVEPGVHPTAIIGAGVQLGVGVSIQAYAVIEPGVFIGDGTVIGAHTYVGQGVRIGSRCRLHPNTSIRERCILGNRVIVHCGAVIGSDGFGFELVEGRYVKIPQIGIVQIDDDVEIGSNTTIDRARFGKTWIGEGTKIDNLVMIAHNVVIGKHSVIVSQVGISGSTRLGNYVTLAGQVGVVGHVEIGDQAVVGAQAGVTKSLAGKQMYWGTPALPIAEKKESLAHVGRLPKLWERVKRLEKLRSAKDQAGE
ncbi:MAG: UDP-3-O-(3-hydroxymyristoyl)glucosamine N-acyltransferase [Verrucomicrobiota bacterium]